MDANTVAFGGDIAPRVATKAVALLLTTAQSVMLTQRYATTENLAKNSGDTVIWRRYEPWAVATQPLTEGVAPTKQPLAKRDYTAVLREYGAWAELTSKVSELHPDNILGVLTKLCGQNFAETMEELTFNFLKAGTNVYYAGSATSAATVNATVARRDFLLVIRGFQNNRVRPLTEIIMPSAKVSTRGIPESYFGMTHPNMRQDVEHVTGFTKVTEYGDPSDLMPAEFGSCEGIRFSASIHCKPWTATGVAGTTYLSSGAAVSASTACDVFPIIIVGKDAYGVVRLQGETAVSLYVSNPGKATPVVDPLGQKGSIGWRSWFAGTILNEYAVAVIKAAATASPSW